MKKYEIQSPLEIFNNLIYNFSKRLENIYDRPMKNNIIFLDNSMLLFNKIKFIKSSNEIIFYVSGPVDDDFTKILKNTINHLSEIKSVFKEYLYLLNQITSEYDTSVTEDYVNTIILEILSTDKTNLSNRFWVIPTNNKIIFKDKTVENLFKRNSYVLTMSETNRNQYRYSIQEWIASNLDKSKSIRNLRPLDKNIIVSGKINKSNLSDFLYNLMYYGKL